MIPNVVTAQSLSFAQEVLSLEAYPFRTEHKFVEKKSLRVIVVPHVH